MAPAGPNSRFLAQKQVSAPSRHGTGTHAKSSIARPQHAQQHITTPHTITTRARRRHGGGGIVLGCCRCGGDRAALVLAAPAVRLPAAPAALPSRCVACGCGCGCGCGPRQLLPRCPLRTEKRKLPELTCELGLSPPGARTRAEPCMRLRESSEPAAGEEIFAPRT